MTGRAALAGYATALALVATIAFELQDRAGAPVPQPTLPARRIDTTQAAAYAGEQSIAASVTTLLARPLFSPKRRPPAAPGAVAAAAPAPLPRLAGVLFGGGVSTAILAAAGRRAEAVAAGGRFGPWTVRAIQAGEVTVTGPDGSDHVLRPAYDPASRAAAVAQSASGTASAAHPATGSEPAGPQSLSFTAAAERGNDPLIGIPGLTGASIPRPPASEAGKIPPWLSLAIQGSPPPQDTQ